jgi:uncharacterized membrane protein (DUF2068 family)
MTGEIGGRPIGRRRDRVLEAIAVYKFVKAALMLAVGLGARKLLDPDVADAARDWLQAIAFPHEPRFLRTGIAWLVGLDDQRIRQLGLVAFGLSALFLIEGVGLWLERRWGEILVAVATASLIPFEVYELWRQLTPTKCVVFAGNVAILAYLIVEIRRSDRKRAQT